MTAVMEKSTTRNAEPASRRAFLAAAAEEFARAGFAGARTESIAHGACVKHTLLFYHFKS
jgi:AcrR family transcriptional regulator